MFSLEVACPADRKEFLIADLWDCGSQGIVETETGLRAFFDDEVDRDLLAADFPYGRIESAAERDWIAAARERLQPMAVGSRFFLVPEWREDPAPDGRLRIVVNPGLAFGTGAHETTRLCLELLERSVRPGVAVADIGTGSGILAEAAKALGAARVIACDIDAQAAAIAALRVPVFIGSASAIGSGTADIATANISPDWIVALAPDLLRVLRPGGIAILSGFEDADLPRIEAALRSVGGETADVRAEASWRAIIARRAPPV